MQERQKGREKIERKRKHLLDDLKEKRRSWDFTEGSLDLTLWRTRFELFEPVVRQHKQSETREGSRPSKWRCYLCVLHLHSWISWHSFANVELNIMTITDSTSVILKFLALWLIANIWEGIESSTTFFRVHKDIWQ